MKNKFIKNLLWGTLSGIILYILATAFSTILYTNISFNTSVALLLILLVIGFGNLLFTISYRTKISDMLIRSVILFFSYIIIFILNGYIGTIHFLHSILNITSDSMLDNLNGLVLLIFTIIQIVFCIIANIVVGIIKWVKREKDTKTGDGSVVLR